MRSLYHCHESVQQERDVASILTSLLLHSDDYLDSWTRITFINARHDADAEQQSSMWSRTHAPSVYLLEQFDDRKFPTWDDIACI